MSNHLLMCKIPQFQNPLEIRLWRQNHVAKCMKCMLEIEHRRIREEKWLKNMKEKKLVEKLTRDMLDLELEEYFIPDTPNSCVSCSCCSTRGISEGDLFINTVLEDYSHFRDGYISSDSIDNFDTFKLSPAISPIRKEFSDSDLELDDWDDLKTDFKDYGKYIS